MHQEALTLVVIYGTALNTLKNLRCPKEKEIEMYYQHYISSEIYGLSWKANAANLNWYSKFICPIYRESVNLSKVH